MKKLNLLYLLACLLVFASCSSSDDDDNRETELSVSVYDLLLEAQEGSYTSTITITSSDEWRISTSDDWLDFTSRSGNAGSAQIGVRAKSINDSSKERIGYFDVIAGNKTKTVTVRQLPALAADCAVQPTDMVIMTDGIAFDFNFGKKVAYYYYGYLDKSFVTGLSDEEIAYISQETFERKTPDEGELGWISYLDPNSEYYLITFAYDRYGKRGDMVKTLFRTKAVVGNRPRIYITNVEYSSTTWEWSTTKSPYTKYYYQSTFSGVTAANALLVPQAVLAWLMKGAIESGDLDLILNDGNWYRSRGTDEEDFFVYTWAVGQDNEFAGELDTWGGSIESGPFPFYSATRASEDKEPAAGVISKESVNELMKNIQFVK